MDIGGYDLFMTIKDPLTNIEIARLLMDFINWQDCIHEDASLNGCHLDDFFWYKNKEAFEAWEKDIGPENTMLHFIFDGLDQLTIVSDKDQHEQLESFLRDNEHVVLWKTR